MLDKGDCGVPTEAELQRACGTLYITHGLESTCGLVMFIFFAIVAVKLHCRSHLNSPALAFLRFVIYHVYAFLDEFVTTLYTVGQMDELKLEARLRFCGNLDKMANATSAVLSLLGITRWLSIGNVNGMRYIGYVLTCPMTQVELVAMLAPIVPCYRLCTFISFLLTVMTLTAGYVASLFEMPVYEGSLITFVQTWNVDDFAPTMKFTVVAPALIGISVLWVIVLPYLMLTYACHGGNRNEDLPQEYRFLVSMVWVTWLGFPCWWFLSWEGNAVIKDTKFNEIGFTVLNMLAKGLFTLQSFRVGELADERMAERRGNNIKNGNSNKKGDSWKRGADGQVLQNQGSNISDEGDCPPIVSRASETKLSASQFVEVLRGYDWSDNEESSDLDCNLQKTATSEQGFDMQAPDAHWQRNQRSCCQESQSDNSRGHSSSAPERRSPRNGHRDRPQRDQRGREQDYRSDKRSSRSRSKSCDRRRTSDRRNWSKSRSRSDRNFNHY